MDEIEKKMFTEKKNKVGRPVEWTEERIADLADKLEEWAKQPDSFALVQFCRNQKIQPNKLSKLARENEEFRSALSYTKTCLASRMIESLNSKDGNLHPAFFNRYIRLNDFFLDEFLKNQEKEQVSEINKHNVRIVDFSTIKK